MATRTEINIIDPRDISPHDLPRAVFTDNLHSFFGWGIKKHDTGYWSHAMLQYDPEYVATQNIPFFVSKHIEEYMKPHIHMKFFGFRKLNATQKQFMISEIKKDLKKPWYKRTYDIPGIIGQILNMPNTFQLPHRNYCTESVSHYIRKVGYCPPKHPNVEKFNRYFCGNPDLYSKEGYWFVLR